MSIATYLRLFDDFGLFKILNWSNVSLFRHWHRAGSYIVCRLSVQPIFQQHYSCRMEAVSCLNIMRSTM